MATSNEESAVNSSGIGKDLAGIPSFLIDPEGAAQRVHSRWFWVAPFLIALVVGVASAAYLIPMMIHVAQQNPPDGMSGEQYAGAIEKFSKVGLFVSPLTLAGFDAVAAAFLLGMSAIMSVKATFGKLFNLVVGCGIIQTLGTVAATAILHFKGEVNTMAELKPAMGPDIFLPEGTNKFLVAALSGFSVFQIWWVVMMALTFAAAFRVSKAKGFIAVIPLWLAAVVLTMVGAAFQK